MLTVVRRTLPRFKKRFCLSSKAYTNTWKFSLSARQVFETVPVSMKKKSPNHRTRRVVARKAVHRKASKPVDLSQLIERLNKLRFNLHKVIVDALKKTKKLART